MLRTFLRVFFLLVSLSTESLMQVVHDNKKKYNMSLPIDAVWYTFSLDTEFILYTIVYKHFNGRKKTNIDYTRDLIYIKCNAIQSFYLNMTSNNWQNNLQTIH